MAIECPRCLLSHEDHTLRCSCGYDLTLLFGRQRSARSSGSSPRAMDTNEMGRVPFLIGVGLIWGLLVAGEWFRVTGPNFGAIGFEEMRSVLFWASTSMAGAVVVGMIGWFVVWIFRSYEGLERRPCAKRMTLLVTGIAACVMFLIRFLSPTTIAGYLVPTLSIILVSVVFYLAGTKHWLGRW